MRDPQSNNYKAPAGQSPLEGRRPRRPFRAQQRRRRTAA